MLLLLCSAALGQQTQSQPESLTFYYDYTVRPGQEQEFMTLVKTVGAPVRDKLMADGVVLAWGIRDPGFALSRRHHASDLVLGGKLVRR